MWDDRGARFQRARYKRATQARDLKPTDGSPWGTDRADGKQIIFRAPDGSPMAVDVTANGAAFQTSAPRQLFPLPPGAANDWDVTPDGRRFLIPVRRTQAVGDEPITVVLNWKASLRR